MSGGPPPLHPPTMSTKTCTKCHETKPLTEFHRDSGKKDGLRNDCKACAVMRSKAHYAKDPQKQKNYVRKRLYGVTPEQVEAMLSAQNGCCAICETTSPGGKGDWHVDHCHTSNVVRGLLCHHCNVGIGHLKDDISTLEKAVLYLKKHQ